MSANKIYPNWHLWSSYAGHQTSISTNCEDISCEHKDLIRGSKYLWIHNLYSMLLLSQEMHYFENAIFCNSDTEYHSTWTNLKFQHSQQLATHQDWSILDKNCNLVL